MHIKNKNIEYTYIMLCVLYIHIIYLNFALLHTTSDNQLFKFFSYVFMYLCHCQN